jgi:hypothetical protein
MLSDELAQHCARAEIAYAPQLKFSGVYRVRFLVYVSLLSVSTMAPKQNKTGTNPHAKRQQDDMIMECLIMLPTIAGVADGVRGKKRQMV